jgi:hypothetical protein
MRVYQKWTIQRNCQHKVHKTKNSKMDSRYLSLHIFLIAVKRRDLGGISPVFIMVNHINKFRGLPFYYLTILPNKSPHGEGISYLPPGNA